jgi:predicted enzyme related to lactoylglutathione lyase
MIGRVSFVTMDATDPERLAAFWGAVLGVEVEERSDRGRFVFLERASGTLLCFQRVPEPKTVKNRVHIDVSPSGCDQEVEVERLLGLGATRVDIGQGDVPWVVLADPEGNEFCVLARRRD